MIFSTLKLTFKDLFFLMNLQSSDRATRICFCSTSSTSWVVVDPLKTKEEGCLTFPAPSDRRPIHAETRQPLQL